MCLLHLLLLPLRVLPPHGMLLNVSDGRWAEFDTAIDVAIRPSGHKEPAGFIQGVWSTDQQGYARISSADTREGWDRYKKQWVKYETIFEAPSNSVSCCWWCCCQEARMQGGSGVG